MIEELHYNNELIAIIIRSNYKKEGIHFFTNQDSFQQVGYMNREEGYKIEPHLHLPSNRLISKTQEVLFIKSGKVQISFYDNNKKFLENKIVSTGDVIFLSSGGHGFLMLEQSEIIEVKQGPYLKEDDKLRF
jgi:mannose-6-phosphate isomerase-like protein (cupin superfamily)